MSQLISAEVSKFSRTGESEYDLEFNIEKLREIFQTNVFQFYFEHANVS
jgi:hypothetical protein